ncbi:energy transducer TonB [Sphingomonas crusticola]|uniref:energy transducer TonB n=1 Tax=Sphingomonas crusticola TaxID=1697973 RepID=UPI000E27204F|nr:energy transducer TonB [Sphingomonas crusticola]
MSYTDQTKRSSTIPMAAVIGVHLAIGYALISGLAFRVIPHIPIVTVGEILPDDPPPPPPHELTVQKTRTATQPTILPPVDQVEALPPQETIVQTVPTLDFSGPSGGGTTIVAEPPKPSLAHDAIPGGDRLRWITTDDYPSAALRQGITGTVVIAALVGPDGRVRACEVTKSSGSPLLDEATCRLYARRAHFTPALDADGNVIAARHVDRFRWQIPSD